MTAFLDLVVNDQSKALRRAFFGERRVAKEPGLADVVQLVGDRMLARYREEALWLRAEGVSMRQVERALSAWGMTKSPFDDAAEGAPDVPAADAAASSIRDDEIVERCVLALVNEGAQLLGMGLVERAVDVDLACLGQCGFPRYRGGPLFYANTLGLANVAEALSRYCEKSGDDAWAPAALLSRLAASDRVFD